LITSFLLYYRTLIFLKPIQIYYRIWFKFVKPKIKDRSLPDLREHKEIFIEPAPKNISFIDKDTFIFLNKIGKKSILGWNDSENKVSRLWRYNQHYFDGLNASFSNPSEDSWHNEIILSWIAENPIGIGTGWESYPLSLRIVNWIKWQLLGNKLSKEALESLAIQTRYLEKRIEWHILGNHIIANAKALVFSGLFFSGNEANKWLKKGIEILFVQIKEQILDDGGNFERSPMYHSIVLEDLLDLINISSTFKGIIPNNHHILWMHKVKKMLTWISSMIHPDGEIAFFNDSAIGIAPSPSSLFSYAKRQFIEYENFDSEFVNFSQSGYIKVKSDEATTFIDVAPIGPDYIPGHAHADTLSFELSIFDSRIFINGGTYEYEDTNIRAYQRSTKAHNTVSIDNENSSEVWNSFRVARRAFPKNLKINRGNGDLSVSSAHNGYDRLKGKPTHNRCWKFSSKSLSIKDCIQGSFKIANAYFHLHPSIVISQKDRRQFILSAPNGKLINFKVLKGNARLETSYFSPEFGKKIQTNCINISFVDSISHVLISWSSNA